MADEIITKQELIDAKPDVKSLGEAANGNETGIVIPRYGASYSTAPAAIQKIQIDGANAIQAFQNSGSSAIQSFQTNSGSAITTFQTEANDAISKVESTGGLISVPTLTALQAITSAYANQSAIVEATGAYYRWNASGTPPSWVATGRNFLTEANTYADAAIQSTGIVKKPYSQIDLKALATLQGFVGTNGAYNANTGFRCTDFIAVSEGQLIAIVAKGHGSVATLATYNSSQGFIQNYTNGIEPYNVNVTVPAGVAFIRVTYTATSTITQTGTLTQPQVFKDITERADFLDLKNNNDYVNSTIKYAAFDKIGQYTTNGTNFLTNTGFATFTPVAIKKGQIITAYMYGSTGGAAGLFFKNAAGTVTKTNFIGSTNAFETLTYTPTEDGTFWINTVIPTDPSFINVVKYRAGYYLTPAGIGVDVPSQKSFDELYGLVNSYWKGKKIVWVGTSIPATDQNGKSYPVLTGEKLGCTMVNQAIGESWISFNKANPSTAGNASYKTMSATKAEIRELAFNLWGETSEPVLAKMEQCSYEYLLIGSGADLVVFDHMHNDMGRSYITYADSEINSMERTSFYGAYNYVIDKLYQDNPNVRIVFVSPPNRFLRASPSYTLEKFDAFRTCLRNLANKYNAPFIDLAVLSNTNQSNYQRWTRTADGVNDDIHPGSAARVRYANILAQAIRAIG